MIFNDRRKTLGKAGKFISDVRTLRTPDSVINNRMVKKAYQAKGNEPRPAFNPGNLSGEQPVKKNKW